MHVSHKKGSLVKPSLLQVESNAQSTWVLGESSSGGGCGDFESLECAAVLDLVPNADPVLGASVVSLSGWLEGVTADVASCATMALVYELESDGCMPMVVFGAPAAVVVVPNSGEVGSTPANTAMVSPALKNGHCHIVSISGQKIIVFPLCLIWVTRWVLSLGKGKIELRLLGQWLL